MDQGSIQQVPIVRFLECNFFFPFHWEKELQESDGGHDLHGHQRYRVKKHVAPQYFLCRQETSPVVEHPDEWPHDLPLFYEGYFYDYDLFD